ncbi:hypothetical protein M0802_008840 [Mischocyttarus mexicanus]|nr:hypothetical protein M0802_008840 [Mischocyttarus mexicanus]
MTTLTRLTNPSPHNTPTNTTTTLLTTHTTCPFKSPPLLHCTRVYPTMLVAPDEVIRTRCSGKLIESKRDKSTKGFGACVYGSFVARGRTHQTHAFLRELRIDVVGAIVSSGKTDRKFKIREPVAS